MNEDFKEKVINFQKNAFFPLNPNIVWCVDLSPIPFLKNLAPF